MPSKKIISDCSPSANSSPHGSGFSGAIAAPLRFAALAIFFALVVTAKAQWVTESYPLKIGYNAIWLSIDASKNADGSARLIADIIPADVDEVWQWNGDASSSHFIEQPLAPVQSDSHWRVWKRFEDPIETTLSLLTPNAAYLIKSSAVITMSLKGRPAPPDYQHKSSGLNFFGFPVNSDTTPTNFTNFLRFSEVLKASPPIYYYDGEAVATSRRLVAPNSKIVKRGEASWIKGDTYTDYYGPIKVNLLSAGGIDYGKKLNTASIRLKNATDPAKAQTVTATLTLASSEAPPGSAEVPEAVQLRVRGQRDENFEFTYSPLSVGETFEVTLAPGEEREIILNAARQFLDEPGKFYASVLQVTDSLGHNRIDLPVSATGTSRTGVWVGAAVLNAVNQVETLSGPEMDAPVGTPDGTGPPIVSISSTEKMVEGGVITRAIETDVTFDEAGKAYLAAPNPTAVSLDLSSYATEAGFAPDADGTVTVVLPQADGKILVGGSFSTLGGQLRNNIGRLNADGSVDASFDPGLIRGSAHVVLPQADGKILIGGYFESLGGEPPEPTVIPVSFADPGGNGTFTLADDPTTAALTATPATGGTLGWFNSGGLLCFGNASGNTSSNPSADGLFNINAAGNFSTAMTFPPGAVIDATTGTTGWGIVTSQTIGEGLTDGTYNLGFRTAAGNFGWMNVTLDEAGTANTTGDDTFTINEAFIESVPGVGIEVDPAPEIGIGRVNADGSLDAGFLSSANSIVRTLVVQPDGKILVGGSFSTLGGQPRSRIGRLNPDGSLDVGFDPGADGTVHSLALQPDGKILVGGTFSTLGGQPRSGIGRLNWDGTLDVGFDPGADGSVSALLLQTDTRILVGGLFSGLGGQARSNIGRLNIDGTLDLTFDPGADSTVRSLALQPDGKIFVGGNFATLGGQSRANLGRLLPGGELDLSYDLGADSGVNSLVADGEGKILVGGNFATLGGQSRSKIGRIEEVVLPAVPGTDFDVEASDRAIVVKGGSGYTAPPSVELTGGGGSGATAYTTLSAGVSGVTVTEGGTGYSANFPVSFSSVDGVGSGAVGLAVVAEGQVTDVFVTSPGSGYASPPTVDFSSGDGSGAAATASISGGVGSVHITAGGSGYTSAPGIVFSGGGGIGADAHTTLVGDVVTGVAAVTRLPNSIIADEGRVSYTVARPAPEGTPEGISTSRVITTRRLVTINRKSRWVERRVHSGGAAAAPSEFPVRLILHSLEAGSPVLMQQAYLGSRDGIAYAGPGQEAVAALVKGPGPTPPGSLGRVSSASFPRGGLWPGSGDFRSAAQFKVTLGHDAESNPFVHTYHPDHDNWDARYEKKLGEGVESYTVTREITLLFDSERPPGVSDLTWGVSTLGGTYTEEISGLRAGEAISISGPFILHQVSEAAELVGP